MRLPVVEDPDVPIIEVHLLKGHPSSVRTRLINAMTDAFRMIVPAQPAAITVLLHEVERDNYMRGGAMRRRPKALPEPVSVLLDYLTALREGDFDKANGFLTEDCEYTLPGGGSVRSPVEVVEWARTRASVMGVDLESTDTSPGDRGPVVYLRGRLKGEFHDGVPFTGVRVVTRYAFDGGKICQVDLWTDLADRLAAHAAKTGARVIPPAVPGTDSADR